MTGSELMLDTNMIVYCAALFSIFMRWIISLVAFVDHKSTVCTPEEKVTNLLFTSDIDGLSGNKQELKGVIQRLIWSSTQIGKDISDEGQAYTKNPEGIHQRTM